MTAPRSSQQSQDLRLISLRGHAEVSRLDLFHQGHGHAPYATIHGRPFKFDTRHGTDCRRDIGEALLGVRIPRNHITGLGLIDQIVGNHALMPCPGKTFHQITQHKNGIGRDTIQPMPGIIAPHQPVDDAINLPHRHVDADQPPAWSAFRSDEPRGRAVTGDPLFNSLGMHPSAAPTYKHVYFPPVRL